MLGITQCLGITHSTKRLEWVPFAWLSLWPQGLPTLHENHLSSSTTTLHKNDYIHPPQPLNAKT